MTADAVQQFRNAMQSAGLIQPDMIEMDGKLHRFASNGKRGDDAGWYVLHGGDIPAGVFGDWRTDFSQTWRADIGRKLTPAEDVAHRAKMEAMRREREAEKVREQSEAAKQAMTIWKAATPASANNPYLSRKQVSPVATLREIDADAAAVILGYSPKSKGEALSGRLLVAPVKVGGALSTLELIDGDKRKSAIYGGAKAGGYWAAQSLPNGDGDGLTLLIGEGVATALSAKDASGHPSIAALSAGNLTAVAKAKRERYPTAALVILADLVKATGAPDTRAIEAARSVGGLLAIPAFGADRPENATDFNDMAQARGLEAVKQAIASASAPAKTEYQPGGNNAPAGDLTAWPAPLADEAHYGLAGEIVREIEPQTESDPAAILIQVLAAFGALVGRGPHYAVEGDQHHTNLFVLIVGDTAKARKGTSWGRVRELFSMVEQWPNVVNGLSTGEGLKWAVRDPIIKMQRDDKNGSSSEIETDPGVSDKRLLVVESEFSQVLKQGARPGNTLSPTVRAAWDGLKLSGLTKTDAVTATGAHICIIGHITADELRAELTATDSANGFANRFLFMCARRSKKLAFGGKKLSPDAGVRLASRIARAAAKARELQSIEMTDAARQIWATVYPTLSEGHLGLLGAVTARAEAQCIRLAELYALMDEAQEIDRAHLLAAFALWERAEASARHIFGTALGDPIADDILRALKVAGANGMTRTAISKQVFSGHKPAERIGAALELLRNRNLARCEMRPTEGAPAEVWVSQ